MPLLLPQPQTTLASRARRHRAVARPAVAAVLGPLIEAGLVATCGVIEFELGWATRSGAEFDLVRADREEGYEWLDTHDEDWHRALEVQGALWRSGHARASGSPTC